MAAIRRLISLYTSNILCVSRIGKPSLKRSKAVKLLAAGVCVASGAGIANYFYTCNQDWRVGLASQIGGRALHLALPSVSATDKFQAKPYDLGDDNVYMSAHENRFKMFSSVEYEGQLYMTPLNFIESVTMSEPKSRKIWKTLSKQELEKILADTPTVCKGSSNMFRNLRERGIIGYTEYLFLLCILTKPHAGFKIAFNMFDADGNEMVDKREFMVLEEIFRKKKDKKEGREDVQMSDRKSLQLYGYRESHAQRIRILNTLL